MDLTDKWIYYGKLAELERIFDRLPEKEKRFFEQEWKPIYKEVQGKFLPWYLVVLGIDSVILVNFLLLTLEIDFWSSMKNIRMFLGLIFLIVIMPLELIHDWKMRVLLEKKRRLLIGIYQRCYDRSGK